jgi:hypothetical protein
MLLGRGAEVLEVARRLEQVVRLADRRLAVALLPQ